MAPVQRVQVLLLSLAFVALGCASTTTTSPPPDVPPVDATADLGVDVGADASTTACVVATDCVWGEISYEIRTRSDCMCLLGCPSTPLNRVTVERRRAQYSAVCDPRFDGAGHPCPVDDCVGPPPLACRSGVCAPGT